MNWRIGFYCGTLLALLWADAQGAEAALQFADPVTLGAIQLNKLTEASGIAVSSLATNVFWTHNDGPKNEIYAFRFDGALLATYNMNKNPSDVEDIATGPGPEAGVRYLYMGDIGSNTAIRDTVRVYRVKEPLVDPGWADAPVSKDFKNVDTCHLHYPDGTYNAEALLIDPIEGALFIATKQPGETRIYRAPLSALQDGVTVELEFVRGLAMSVVSGGTISADGSLIALRREDYAIAWQRQPGETVSDTLARPETEIPVVGSAGGEPNGEAICFLPDLSGYVTLSEGLFQPIYFFQRIAPVCTNAPAFLALPFVQPDGLHLTFRACAGATVVIERASEFGAWQDIGTVQINSDPSSFTDANTTGTRFYRLRQGP